MVLKNKNAKGCVISPWHTPKILLIILKKANKMNCNISYNIDNKCIFARPNALQIILVALFSINYLSILAYNKTERIKIEKTPEIQKGKKCIWHITIPSDISDVD